MAETPTPKFDPLKLLQSVVRRALRVLHVSMPARVDSYDRQLRRATVLPQIRERFPDGQVRDRPPIASRPVLLPQGGGFGLWFDLEQGDPCVTLVADETTAGFYETGETTTPVFGQRHQLSDAVILPGGAPTPEQVPVNGEGEAVIGTRDLAASIIIRRATVSTPAQAGTIEIRVATRLDLGGAGGREVGRSGDPVEPNSNFTTVMGKVFTAANSVGAGITPAEILLFEQAMGAIKERPDAVVYSK